MVNIAALRGPFRPTCLERSLVLWWLLQRDGIQSDLRIGVRKDEGELKAHAWVEYGEHSSSCGPDSYGSFVPFEGSLIEARDRSE